MSQADQVNKSKRKLPSWVFIVLILASAGAKLLKTEHKQDVQQQQVEQVEAGQQ